jgi:hypothetical protein
MRKKFAPSQVPSATKHFRTPADPEQLPPLGFKLKTIFGSMDRISYKLELNNPDAGFSGTDEKAKNSNYINVFNAKFLHKKKPLKDLRFSSTKLNYNELNFYDQQEDS